MNIATSRPSRPTGVTKHRVYHPDGSVTVRTIRTDKYGITRKSSVTYIIDNPPR